MKTKILFATATLSLFAHNSLQAILVETFLGDVDTFGTNQTLPDGFVGSGTFMDFDNFTSAFVTEASDPFQTDTTSSITSFTPMQFNTNFAPGSILAASLEFRTYGMGDGGRGPHDVLFNGTSIGITPIFTAGSSGEQQQLATQIYTISPSVFNFGSSTQEFSLTLVDGDGFYLDYVKLTTEVVPEPSSFALLTGIMGLSITLFRRRY